MISAHLFCKCGKELPGGYATGDDDAVCGLCEPNAPGAPTSAKADFYQFVNRDWLQDESITIPAEYSSWGSFVKLTDESLKNQIKLLGELVGKPGNDDEKKVSLLWNASMTRFKAWAAGEGSCSEIHDELGKLNAQVPWAESDSQEAFTSGLATYFSRCAEIGTDYPFGFSKEANLNDSENVVLDLSPNGLSLPSRDYYLDDKFKEQQGWFKEHLEKVVEIIGADKLETGFVNKVVELETKLAQISMKKDQERQFDEYFCVSTLDGLISELNTLKHLKAKESNYPENKVVNLMDGDKEVLTSAEFQVGAEDLALLGKFWEQMFKDLRLREVMVENYKNNYPERTDAESAQYRMMVFDGDYFRRVFQILFRKKNRSHVKAYMQYKIIRSGAGYCTKALNEEVFDFFGRKLNGQKEQKTEEKRSMSLINTSIGELMGKIYVAKFFSEEDKNTVHGLVKDVLLVMENSLQKNDWLTEETKQKALHKLSKFVVKLGYPEKWKNHDKLVLEESDSLFAMYQKIQAFAYQTEFLAKLNSVKDKTKWEMNPQDVNAYFHPLNNEIVFPAAIMQPPFYFRSLDTVDFEMSDIKADLPYSLAAANLGAIGAVIAHEITHGYDDQGRKFDADGNINDWWSEADAELFKGKCALMVEQAEKWSFEDKDGAETKVHRMNGELTMGENLADLGGLSLASQALKKRCGGDMSKDYSLVFFRSWANVWKSKETKACIINKLQADPHAPPSFRGNLVKNIDSFYEAFDVLPGDDMHLPKDRRVQMW